MLPLPCMLVCTFVCANRTRDRGCSVHPVFPAPSKFWRANQDANLGRNAPRDREGASPFFESNPKSLSSSLRTQGPITTGRNCLVRSLLSVFSNNNSRGVWVPAFAGTTFRLDQPTTQQKRRTFRSAACHAVVARMSAATSGITLTPPRISLRSSGLRSCYEATASNRKTPASTRQRNSGESGGGESSGVQPVNFSSA